MFITKMSLPRRTVLRGIGATVALPFLDAMAPALGAAPAPSSRMGFIYVPNGQALVNFIPKDVGPNFTFSPTLKPLEPFRDRVVVASGLSNLEAESKDLGTGPHTRGSSVWINGVRPKRTEGADVQAGKTLDQYAADVLGADTQLRSLEMALESNYNMGNCDNGYSCVYLNTFSWRTPTVPMPMEHNPRVIFERLFGEGETARERLSRIKHRRSFLDGVNAEMTRLQKVLGPRDRTVVSEYLDAVREVEQRIQRAENGGGSGELPIAAPNGVPDSYDECIKLMYDLMLLAYRGDVTRVVSFQIGREQSGQTYPWIGVPEADHETSHHGPDPEKTARRTKVNVYHAQLLAYLVEKLKATPDGDGTLLDHLVIMYGSGLGDGNVHSTHNLPVLLVGGACGQLQGNRHVQYALDTPLMNLGVTLLNKAGVRVDKVGDSTGPLADCDPAVDAFVAGVGVGNGASRAINTARIATMAKLTPTGVRTWGVLLLTAVWAVGSMQATTMETPLIQAVKASDVKAVRALLLQHLDVNAAEVDGSTALHWAADHGDAAMVDVLLKAGANPKVANRYGVTPLSLACLNGNASVIERLLQAGADPNAMMTGGETALMTAARTGRPEAIKVLLAHGAKVNATEPTRNQSALMWAAAAGNVEAVKVLVESGADIHARSDEKDFRTRFTGNGGAGHVKLEKPIEFTPLMFAIRSGRVDVVRELVSAGADPKETLPDGTSTVCLALINAHWELANYLLDHGADPNAAGQGWTALHQLARSRSLTIGHVPQPVPTGHVDSLEVGKKLIKLGANVNARMTSEAMKNDGYRTDMPRIGATPYMLAAKGVDHALMRLLLANGADPKIPNNIGMTPLMVAAGVALHSPGEDSGTDEDALEAVRVALDVDNDVNAADSKGETPMHGAGHRGVVPVIELLIARGARLDATFSSANFVGQTYRTDKGMNWTPLTMALGRQKDGKPIFLGEQRNLTAALAIYKVMKDRGLPIDEDPASVATLDKMLGNGIQP